jgi:arylsulfatase
MNGLFNENSYFNYIPENIEDLSKKIDKFGTRESYGHFAAGWAVAGNTPFRWTKQVAGDFGGTRNGVIIQYPKAIKDKGAVRNQFCHVVDIAPTILELCQLPQPKIVNGVEQEPMHGFSMVESFKNAQAPEFHTTQYFEITGNRGLYHEGWLLRTIHRAAWETQPRRAIKDDIWELYQVDQDFSLSTDVAAKYPEKVKELKALFVVEAKKYHVLPIDDRSVERLDPLLAGRPDAMAGRTKLTVYQGMGGLQENAFINLKNQSSSITATVDVKANSNGVLIAMGGKFGGYSLYVKNGVPMYTYNWSGHAEYDIKSNKSLTAGKHVIKYVFTYDGGGRGKGGTGMLYIDDELVGKGRIEKTNPNVISLDEGADVGMDEATNVSKNYPIGERNVFNGSIEKIEIEILPTK